MYNPASDEDDWEWIEIYNAGSTTINLAGYVLDDNNSEAHTAANIAGGSIMPGQTAILFNDDDLDAVDFEAAWGSGLNLIGVAGWFYLRLNNDDDGDRIGLWSSFASYSGDHENHNNTIFDLTYDDSSPWPVDNDAASIYLTDLNADYTIGSNWARSQVGTPTSLFVGYRSAAAGGNSGADIGSPGPSSNLVINKSVNSSTFQPGDIITYTLTFSNTGPYPTSGIIITDIVPISVTNLSVISSGAIITQTNTGVSTYTWSVQSNFQS